MRFLRMYCFLEEELMAGRSWKLGEFCNVDGQDAEVSISLKETSATLKLGLVAQGIEIKPKKQNGHWQE